MEEGKQSAGRSSADIGGGTLRWRSDSLPSIVTGQPDTHRKRVKLEYSALTLALPRSEEPRSSTPANAAEAFGGGRGEGSCKTAVACRVKRTRLDR